MRHHQLILLPLLFAVQAQAIAATSVATATMSATVLAAPSAERTAPDAVTVRWAGKPPVDLFLVNTPDAGIDQAQLVSAKDKDGIAVVAVDTVTRPYFLLRDSKTGSLTRIAERLVPLEKGSNFRDLGGYSAADGKTVRWGLLYRAGATALLTEADQQRVQALGLTSMIDLRSDEERVLAPSRIAGVPYRAIGYSMAQITRAMSSGGTAQNGGALYRNFPTMLAPQLRLVFDEMKRGSGPLEYNCSAGQDRTGFTTAMILSALGVPRDVIITDYHLSTTYRRPENEMPKIDTAVHKDNPVAMLFARYQGDAKAAAPQPLKDPDGSSYLASAFDEIEKRWGSVDAYLKQEIGLSPIDVAALRLRYTE